MEADRAQGLKEAVQGAYEAGERLRIVGTGSKAFLTRGAGEVEEASAALLSVAEHCGVIDYRPEELVITARAGTPLRELEQVLARSNQYLPFEPPRFHGNGTLGGAVASGLAGPGRPWRGSVRDAVLGVELINGLGEQLRFGGQVMKNVAGYDVSRLQVGAFGTLGLLLSVSVKVLPLPPAERTRLFELPAAQALARCRSWARQPYPLSGACYSDGVLRIRLSGAAAAVDQAAAELGGEDADIEFWRRLRDHRLEALAGDGLWRCSLPPAAAEPLADCVVDWAGAQRWWRPGAVANPARVVAREGGHGRPFDGSFGTRDGAHLGDVERHYAARLKQAFDPAGVLNPHLSAARSGHAY